MKDLELQKTGTTTLAIKCKDGVIIGADKRTTAGHMVVGRNAQKIHKLVEDAYVAWAGVVSENQVAVKTLQAELKLRQLKLGRKLLIQEIATLMANSSFNRLRTPSTLMPITSFIVAGKDVTGTYVYDITPDGTLTETKDFITNGSGSVFSMGVLEDGYNANMSLKEAISLARRAFNVALLRDSASGNGFKIYSITKEETKLEADENINTGIAS